jgi:hypothetical protein
VELCDILAKVREEGEERERNMAGMVWSRARFSCPLRVAVQV